MGLLTTRLGTGPAVPLDVEFDVLDSLEFATHMTALADRFRRAAAPDLAEESSA